jgi:tyrosyl-tRNA synthetase
MSLKETLLKFQICSSLRDAKRLIIQGGIFVNGEIILDPNFIIHKNNFQKRVIFITKGKTQFLLIYLKNQKKIKIQ